MHVERTVNVEYITKCVTHPKIWDMSSDDGSVEVDKYIPVIQDNVYWLSIMHNQPLGVFLLYPHNYVCYEVHTCLLPIAWGMSEECAKIGMEWMFSSTPCQRIITNIPEYNELAIRMAVKSGMEQFGVNIKSFLKKGKLYNEVMFGISKKEV